METKVALQTRHGVSGRMERDNVRKVIFPAHFSQKFFSHYQLPASASSS